jgi:hypothetical protein
MQNLSFLWIQRQNRICLMQHHYSVRGWNFKSGTRHIKVM